MSHVSNESPDVSGPGPAEQAAEQATAGPSRRGLLARAGWVGAAVAGSALLGDAAPAGAALRTTYGPRGRRFAVTDDDILNFALNLEYLEAEFYQRAAFGAGLLPTDTGGQTGNVTGGTRVPFASAAVRSYAEEIAGDELAHVRFLRNVLGSRAVVEPGIDFTTAFTAAARAAGVVGPTGTFDPFADDASFLLGAYVFEDVGVTAYHGGAPFIRTPAYLNAAAGILAVEAYHAGSIRTNLYASGPAGITAANQIAAARAMLSQGADGVPGTDQGIAYAGPTPGTTVANITPTDGNALAFSRSFGAVLNIVYLGGFNPTTQTGVGGFFPHGLNGRIR